MESKYIQIIYGIKVKPLVSCQFQYGHQRSPFLFSIPHSTSVTYQQFTLSDLLETLLRVLDLVLSPRSSLAGLLHQHGLTTTHGCLVATECDISMLSLKRLFLACSQCRLPLSSIPPTVPLIQRQCSCSPLLSMQTVPHLTLQDKLDILFHTLFTGTFCPCATSLSSHSAISLLHLSPHGPFPFSLPYFLFCLLNNYVLIS